MGTLTVTFSGICSHFKSNGDTFQLPDGVFHRAVLPRTGTFRFDAIRSLNGPGLPPDGTKYYLQPHFAAIAASGDGKTFLPFDKLTTASCLRKGVIDKGCTIHVANEVGAGSKQPPKWERSYDEIPRLADFVEKYEPSSEVVLGNRATAYFDVRAGEATIGAADVVGDDGPRRVQMVFTTDGAPKLSFTPFGGGNVEVLDFGSPEFRLDDVFLAVFNSELPDTVTAKTPYDFMLHYLTAVNGADQVLRLPLPGMTTDSLQGARFNVLGIVSALNSLSLAFVSLATDGLNETDIAGAVAVTPLNASCSNSQYP